MATKASIRTNVAMDWGRTTSLRIRARALAEGVYAGSHKSIRRGAGVEFGGYRPYVEGDDLRWLDRRSMLLHDKLIVRQFETETDRTLRIAVDATLSMSYQAKNAPLSKYEYAALLSAGLSRIALSSGDPVGLSIMGGKGAVDTRVPARASGETFERIVALLDATEPAGDLTKQADLLEEPLDLLSKGLRRGTISVILTDLFDAPLSFADAVGALASRGRVAVVVQVLDRDEASFPFEGPLRLRALEGEGVVDTDQDARERYLAALAEWKDDWRKRLTGRGARFVDLVTDEEPISALRRIVTSIG
ncbi:MAG: DUF58 domain-containing protein [Polyangiaceae bacterium]